MQATPLTVARRVVMAVLTLTPIKGVEASHKDRLIRW